MQDGRVRPHPHLGCFWAELAVAPVSTRLQSCFHLVKCYPAGLQTLAPTTAAPRRRLGSAWRHAAGPGQHMGPAQARPYTDSKGDITHVTDMQTFLGWICNLVQYRD